MAMLLAILVNFSTSCTVYQFNITAWSSSYLYRWKFEKLQLLFFPVFGVLWSPL